MKNWLGVISLEEDDAKLGELCKARPTAMLPFAGRFRLIDFPLSLMVNHNVNSVGLFITHKTRSVLDHLGSGKAWDLDRMSGYGLNVFMPTIDYNARIQKRGDLELFYENRSFFEYAEEDTILFCKSHTICNLDLTDAYKAFVDSGADITMLYKDVSNEKNTQFYQSCLNFTIDEDDTITSIGKILPESEKSNAYIEISFLKKSIFIEMLNSAIDSGKYSYLRNLIVNEIVDKYKVTGYKIDGYAKLVHDTSDLFALNMEMLTFNASSEIFASDRPIFTKIKNEPPTHYTETSNVKNSLVANGCIIEGNVENSIIFRGVKIKKGATVKNSIVMQKSIIEKDASLNYSILDKYSSIGESTTIAGLKSTPFVVGKKKFIVSEEED